MRVQLVRVDFDRALKAFARLIQLGRPNREVAMFATSGQPGKSRLTSTVGVEIAG